MTVNTKSGFTCEVDEDALNDWEIVEKLVAAQGRDYSAMISVIKDLLGAEGYDAMKDFVRTDKGRVPIDKVSELFFEILSAAGEQNLAKKK